MHSEMTGVYCRRMQRGQVERANDAMAASSQSAGSPQDTSVHIALWSQRYIRGSSLRRPSAGNAALSRSAQPRR